MAGAVGDLPTVLSSKKVGAALGRLDCVDAPASSNGDKMHGGRDGGETKACRGARLVLDGRVLKTLYYVGRENCGILSAPANDEMVGDSAHVVYCDWPLVLDWKRRG